jgi:putative solute:sodium symporter small subunit
MTDQPEPGVRADQSVAPPDAASGHGASAEAYWRKNLQYVGTLTLVWFVVSFGAGIIFVEPLNEFRVPGTGFPLGFWFAQQGSIYIFVILIFVYVVLMNRLDQAFGVGEVDE